MPVATVYWYHPIFIKILFNYHWFLYHVYYSYSNFECLITGKKKTAVGWTNSRWAKVILKKRSPSEFPQKCLIANKTDKTIFVCTMYKGMNQTAAQHLLSSMLPYDSMGGMGLYEQTKPSLMYRVPRVIPDQKGRFESDELFRRLSRESEVSPSGSTHLIHSFWIYRPTDVSVRLLSNITIELNFILWKTIHL